MEPLLLTSRQLSKIISIPTYTIRKLVRQGVFPAYKINGKSYLFNINEVLKVIEDHRVNNSF